jgi:hypothetical protein
MDDKKTYEWKAWLPYRETADGTIDTLIASPRMYCSKPHAFEVGVSNAKTVCGTFVPQEDDHLGWYPEVSEYLKPRCKLCVKRLEMNARKDPV